MVGIDSIISAAGDLASGVMNMFGQHSANQANRRLAEYQYEKNLEMWNRQNEYNSPKSQMQRLQDAGLNPNLIYGSSGNTGNASSMPEYSSPTMTNELSAGLGINQAVQAAMTAARLKSDMDTAKEQRAYIRTQGDALRTQMELTNIKKLQDMASTEGTKITNALLRQTFNSKVRQAAADAKLTELQSEGRLIANRTASFELENMLPLNFRLAEQRWRNGEISAAKMSQEIKNLSADEQRIYQSIVNMRTQNAGQLIQNEGLSLGNEYQRKKNLYDFSGDETIDALTGSESSGGFVRGLRDAVKILQSFFK